MLEISKSNTLLIPSLSLVLMAQISSSTAQFQQLQQRLEGYGFEVLREIPPVRRAYGAFSYSSRTIWLNPIIFDLNIALPTLIHEAVHAAQSCAAQNGEIEPLGLEIQPISQARPFFRHYHDLDRQDLEREAYAVQTHPDSFELVLSLLEKHCENSRALQ